MRTGTETIQSLTADTPLFETEANALSAGRVWLRRTSVGYLCIGLGPSAALTRFAFEDVADAHPFYKAWRRLDRDVARDGSEKARRLGLRIPFGALADPALRRLAIASALLKAGFDPNQSRDDDGRWTSGAAGAAAGRVSPEFLPKSSSPLLGPVASEVIAALRLLALRGAGAFAVLGTIFLPTNKSLITEGTVPGRPDLTFKYDDGEGVLRLFRDTEQGRGLLLTARPDADGIFRDDQGNAIGRKIPDAVVIDPDTLPRTRTSPNVDDNEPKVCPDPTRDKNRGQFAEDGSIDPAKIDDAARYQTYISNLVNPINPLPMGMAVKLLNPITGNNVYYDDCRRTTGTMVEAKSGYLEMMEKKNPIPWLGAVEYMRDQARRQVQAAGGRDIEWYFSEKKVADFMRTQLANDNRPIRVIYAPAPW